MDKQLFLAVWCSQGLLAQIKYWYALYQYNWNTRRIIHARRRDLLAHSRINSKSAYYGLKYGYPELFWRAFPYLWTDTARLSRYAYRLRDVRITQAIFAINKDTLTSSDVIHDLPTLKFMLEMHIKYDKPIEDRSSLRVSVADPEVRAFLAQNVELYGDRVLIYVDVGEMTEEIFWRPPLKKTEAVQPMRDVFAESFIAGYEIMQSTLRVPVNIMSPGLFKMSDPSPRNITQADDYNSNALWIINRLKPLYHAGCFDLMMRACKKCTRQPHLATEYGGSYWNPHRRDLAQFTAEQRKVLVERWGCELGSKVSRNAAQLLLTAGWKPPVNFVAHRMDTAELLGITVTLPEFTGLISGRNGLWQVYVSNYRNTPKKLAEMLRAEPDNHPSMTEWLRRWDVLPPV